MKTLGKAKELFDAFSRINAKAYKNPRLVSCNVLSKAPHYDDVLRRFVTAAPIRPVSAMQVMARVINPRAPSTRDAARMTAA